jgi:hypothetical protein
MGWFAFPMLALLPATGLPMTLHVGKPALPALAPGEPIALAQASRRGRVATERRAQAFRLAAPNDPGLATVAESHHVS